MLLQAFDEEDPQAARQALNSPFIKHMDVEYSRLARDLPLPEGEVPVSRPSIRKNAAPSYVSPKGPSAASGNSEVRAPVSKVSLMVISIISIYTCIFFAIWRCWLGKRRGGNGGQQ
jgi:hypothetical protein